MSQSLSSSKVKSRAGKSLEERLSSHPQLWERIEALLNVVENNAGDIEQADLAEERVIEEVRQIGQKALSSWAETQHQKQVKLLRQKHPSLRKHLKKNSTGTAASEPSRFKNSSLLKAKENR